jgi:uncharacterized phage protein gp47/JayE
MDLPNKTELFERMIEEAIAFHNGKLTETTMRQEGTDANSLLMAGVALGDEICYQIYLAIKNSNPQTAEQEDLDKLLFDWFSLTRLAASSSITTLKFERSGTTEGIIPAGYICSTNNGISFKTNEDLIFADSILTGSVQATAVQAGIAGNVDINTITIMEQPQFDNTFTCINADHAVGGRDQETDAQFRRRAAEYWTVQQKGTKDAIIFGAKQVPGVNDVYFSETAVSSDQNARYLQMVIADPSGNSDSTLVANVQNELEDWRAAGVWVEVLGGTAVDVTFNITYDYKAGFNEGTVDGNVIKNILFYVNNLKLGETLYVDVIKSLIAKTSGVYGNVDIVLPSANIVPTAYQILKTDATLISINA